MVKAPPLRRGQHLPQEQRAALSQQLLREYEGGKSIRQLCAETEYSIGRVRRLLQEAGVKFRRRGGARTRSS